jgi:hypothetical protein
MNTNTDVKLLGSVARSFMVNLRFDETIADILQSHGINKIVDTEWYSVSTLNLVLADIVEARQSLDSMFDMIAIGMQAANNAPVPEGLSFETFITNQQPTIDQIYSGEPKGKVNAIKLGENYYKLEVYLPWTSDVMYGNYYGFAKRLLPPTSSCVIEKHPDYTEGDIPMIFYIRWD